MNRRIAATTATAVLLWGIVAVLVPQHAVSAGRVVAAAVAVMTGALVLGAVGATAGRELPENELDLRPRSPLSPLDPHGLRDARRDLGRPHAAGSVPIAVWERLVASLRDRDALDARTQRLLSARPPAGTQRDPAAVAAAVHRTLDAFDRLRPGDRR